MRIAIIGSGISGNLCARLLADEHQVDIYEAGSYPGGHAKTVTANAFNKSFEVDTGFMVFNYRTYPNFTQMLDCLGIESQTSDMSFSVRCERTGLEYQGSSLNGLFAQRSNLMRPSFYGMIGDILRFNRRSLELLDTQDDSLSIGEYLSREGYGDRFIHHYLIPMGAAIWSARPEQFFEFPARFLIGFLKNHGLLEIRNRPVWRTIPGGSQRYVQALLEPLADRVRLNTPVESVTRHEDHVLITARGRKSEIYEQVVFATHADQSLRLLTDATNAEHEILRSFPYQRNVAILHTDASLLPRRRRAWASWNYHLPANDGLPVAVTYDVNRLQQLGAPQPICVTLNHDASIDPGKILARIDYDHPAYATGAVAAQQRHAEINGVRRTYYCGAYWGYGFHEDGVNSALAVCRYFGKDMGSWRVASTKASSRTAAAVQ